MDVTENARKGFKADAQKMRTSASYSTLQIAKGWKTVNGPHCEARIDEPRGVE
jgi:hypothetical protein